MGKIGTYQPTEKYKNYSLPTSKPSKGHAFYQEKGWNLQDHVYKKLKKVAELLKSLHPELIDGFNINSTGSIEKNLEILIKDLDLMQNNLHKNSYSFNTNKLKTNQHCITEMKNVCDTLQTVESYAHEFKKLSKIKHALHELEHFIQPKPFEGVLEKTKVKAEPKTLAGKKEPILAQAKKEKKSIVSSKKQKTIPKKTKAPTKLLQTKKSAVKQPSKTKATASKLKKSVKKVAKLKTKSPVKHKKVLTTKPKLKKSVKKVTKLKTKPSSAKHKKVLASKPKLKTSTAKVGKK